MPISSRMKANDTTDSRYILMGTSQDDEISALFDETDELIWDIAFLSSQAYGMSILP